jgi:type I restriction enzyme S subunit
VSDCAANIRHSLESIADIRYGFTAKASFEPIGPKFLRITDIQDGIVDWDSVPFCKVPKKDLEKFKLSPGEIVFARTGATTGKSYLIRDEVEAVFASYLIRVKPANERIFPQYLAYYFQTADYWADISAGTEGAAQGGFNASKLGQLQVPLPPVEEQKRIVAVLDQAFAALDRARAHAEANLADAEELLENSLNEVFRDLATTSPVVQLEDVVHPDCKLSYGIVQPGDELDTGLPIVRPVDLKQRVITLAGLKRISPDLADGYTRTKLVGDELLLCVRGSTGELSIASPELAGGNVTRGIVPIRFEDDKVLREFAYFQFRSRYVRDQIAAKTYGAALMQINIKDLRQLNFIVPPISQQRGAVERAENLYERSHKLRNSYAQKLADLANLRQSLLQKAFSGQLT